MKWNDARLASLGLLLSAGSLYAQSPVSATGAQANAVPVFLDSGTIGSSNITVSGSTVSITGEVLSTGPGAGFRVLGGAGDDVNQAPWYGVGEGSVNLFPGQQNAVQVAGYFGLDFETATGTVVVRGDSGYIGLNTTSPEEMLEVNGNIKLTTGTGAYMEFPDQTYQSTAWNGILFGGDYAESVDVSGDRDEYEAGDVLVIDPAFEGKFLKSSSPYSTAVTGVYSTKPGVVGRRQLTPKSRMQEEVPMAMTGIVPTKVSAENGPIKLHAPSEPPLYGSFSRL